MAKYYYGDLLLPAPPADVLAEYPYAWIRKRPDMGHYQLIFSKNPWYYSGGEIRSSGTSQLYAVVISSASTATEWISRGTNVASYPVDSSKPCIWSNYDIPNGSTTATEIYFYGIPLVRQEDVYKVSTVRLTAIADAIRAKTDTQALLSLEQMATEINGITVAEPMISVPPIPMEVLSQYPYAWIRKRPDMGHYQLFLSANPWYYSSGNIISSGNYQLYAVYISSANEATEWLVAGTTSGSCPVNSSKPCVWANCNIPNGSADATDIYFAANRFAFKE